MKTIRFESGDWLIDRYGRSQWVEGLEKAQQDVAHTLMQQDDGVVGADLDDLFKSQYPLVMIRTVATLLINDAIDRLCTFQSDNLSPLMTEEELIHGIGALKIIIVNKVNIVYKLWVQVKSEKDLELMFDIDLKHQDITAEVGQLILDAGYVMEEIYGP